MTNHQRHFSNTLHSAASHLPTRPWRLPVSPPKYILHNTAAQTRGALWDTEPTVGLYSLPGKAEPFSLHYNLFHMLWRVSVQDTGKGSGSQLNIQGTCYIQAEMNPLRKHRPWKARNVRKGM